MVIECKIVFDLNDIRAIRMECMHSGCNGVILVDLTKVKDASLQQYCPFCNERWTSPKNGTPESDLIRALNMIRYNGRTDIAPVHFLFELDKNDCKR